MRELLSLNVDRRQAIGTHHYSARGQMPSGKMEPVADEVQDTVDDLRELRALIDDLDNSMAEYLDQPASVYSNNEWMTLGLERKVTDLAARHRRCIDLVERASRWSQSRELQALLRGVRKECLHIKDGLREAYRQKGTMLCLADWQSPIYSSSQALGRNRLTHGIKEHYWDYKRDGHLDAVAYEEQFIDQYAMHLGATRLKAYVANCGMAAFTTVLHWLAHEQRQLQDTVLALKPMYFENLHLAQSVFPNLIQLEPTCTRELITYLRQEQPSIVILDAVTNCGEVLSQDMDCVLNWARYEAEAPVSIIIDTTCLPSALLPSGQLKRLPERVSVFLIESLAKYHQFGMDTVTGGIILADMKQDMQVSFFKSRARLGTNLADTSVGSLPTPDRQSLTKRMQRHSRNTRLLAESLESKLSEHSGALQSISWLRAGTQVTPWFKGTCLNVRLVPGLRSVACYQQYEKLVLELAQSNNHLIAFGTSFGFDVSRLYVTAPSTRFEEPFLRISVGTETKAEIEALVDILLRASVELKRTQPASPSGKDEVSSAPSALSTRTISSPILLPREPELKPGLRSSVFCGEDALKNYLCPENYAASPLVELPSALNKFKADGVRLFAKMMPLVPLMNIKSLPAYSMLNKAFERGQLEGVENIIESSSSNTVLSLSVIAKLFGIDTTCAIVDHSIAPSLVRMLRLFGIEIFMHPGMGHELYGKLPPRSERAAARGAQPGWLNPGQYSNPDNPDGFERWLAPELWAQTDGRLGVLSCGLGTCGTMVGVSRGLRKRNPDVQVVSCSPVAGQAVPGPREQAQLSDVSFPWQTVADAHIELTAKESFVASVELLRKGIMGGPSSGMNYQGALRYLEMEKAQGRLAQRVKSEGELFCVFLCCDSPLPHVDEYFDALGDEHFPAIHAVNEAVQEASPGRAR